ncbi:Polygalacturonase, partial [Bertholletia excelsa]
VPSKNNLVKPIKFSGPCKSVLTLLIYGTVEASSDVADYNEDARHWLLFDSVQSLMVEGGGTLDGNGMIWWLNPCKINKALPCKIAPTALTFCNCKDITVQNLNIQNGQQIHISFEKCVNVLTSNLVIPAPGYCPHTNGIHIANTQNIQIFSNFIRTGDDCVSVASGFQQVHARGIICGPGHGISTGSLGHGNTEAHVPGVPVDGAKLSGTASGIRIKTWQGGFGSASDITFQNVEMHNVTNPIIIDQYYCDQNTPCPEEISAVQVVDVVYRSIKRTSGNNIAIRFDCSKTFPCQGIVLEDVDIEKEGGGAAIALCNNAQFSEMGVVSPFCPFKDEMNTKYPEVYM